jgi:sugar diacid utilization regulator
MALSLLPHVDVDDRDALAINPAPAELSSAELSELLEVSQSIAGSLDFGHVLDKVVNAARTLLGTNMSTLLIPDDDGRYLTVAASTGMRSDVARKLSTPVGQNLAGLAAKTGRPVRCSDVAWGESSSLADGCAGHTTSCLLVPMRRHDRVLGVLGVEAPHERVFTDREECILQLLADHAATAIETASLYSAEHERAEQLNRLLERLHAQNDVMRRSREAHDRLAEAALEGLGHDALLRVLVGLVPAPIVVVNQFGSLLGGDAPAPDDGFDALWQSCAASPVFGRQLERLRANVGLVQPSAVPEAGFWRTVPVLAAGELLGALVVLDHERLEELHMVVLEEAASMVAAELLRERSIAEVESRAHGDLVRTLVSVDGWGDQAKDRAALLGYDLTSGQCVIAIRTATEQPTPEPAAVLSASRRAAERVGLRSLAASVEGLLTVVLTSGDRKLARDLVDEWIAEFGEQLAVQSGPADLTYGVSPVACAPGETADAFSKARQALAVCRLGAGAEVTYFDDVDLIALLIDITNEDAVERYIEQTIGELQQYDARKRTDLMGTLETYLDCSGVARHAAKALYLHPHSLRYRLRRIAEIQELDLDDPMARLSSHLALKLRALITQPA